MDSVDLAKRIRIDALEMISKAQASHIGSVFSIADIVAVLYSDILRIVPSDPYNPSRDRFILSKGHAGVAIYAVLAECGFFPKSILDTYYQNGGYLSGHVSSKGVPGVELSTGSLGHGAGVACGLALAAKIDKMEYNVYCIIGDGESEEGSIFEMALFANRFDLNNLTIILDNNNLQAMGTCESVIGKRDYIKQWKSLGWDVIPVNGHDHKELKTAFETKTRNPKLVLAKTTKGKGVSFMENDNIWHYRPPIGEDLKRAMDELRGKQ